jgi:hypothetical protein
VARGIDEAAVFEVADRLLSQGHRPTIERVRRELGRGSPNTVNRHLDEWWASLAERMRLSSEGAVPASLLELCGRLYTGLKAEASRDADQLRKNLQGEQQRLEQARQALDAEKVGVAATVRELRSELSAVHQKLAQALEQIRVLDRDLARERQAAAQATQAAQAAAEERVRSEATSTAELLRAREQAAAHEKRLLIEIDRVREDAKRQRAEHATHERRAEQVLATAEKQLQLAGDRQRALEAEVKGLRQAVETEREARLVAEAALQVLRSRTTNQAAPRGRSKPPPRKAK